MDRSTPITLIANTFTTDAIGQQIPIETTALAYANIQSVTRAEWQSAGEMGLKPEYRATIFSPDYSGQTVVELNGTRYGVYRTYIGKNDSIELYLEKKAGL